MAAALTAALTAALDGAALEQRLTGCDLATRAVLLILSPTWLMRRSRSAPGVALPPSRCVVGEASTP